MHLNKLSTAALMRLCFLVSLNLLMVRFVGYWSWLLDPLDFLIVVTLDLGLYALMVYTGTLNKALIAMMLAGLGGVLIVIAFSDAHTSFFTPSHKLAEWIEDLTNETIKMFPEAGFQAPPSSFWSFHGVEVAYVVVDAMGLGAILASGLLARVLQARSRRRDTPVAPSLDSAAASPL